MLRATAGRFLLLSASVLLLWSASCGASPMWRSASSSSGPKLIPYSPENAAMEAYVQNLPHYLGYPVMDSSEPPHIRRYAFERYGKLYLHDVGDDVQLGKEFTFFDGKQKTTLGLGEGSKLRSQLEMAGQETRHTARALMFGKPFEPTKKKPLSWDKIWKQGTKYELRVANEDYQKARHEWRQSPEFMNLRNTLKNNGHVMVRDWGRNELQTFRLLANGEVEMDIRTLTNFLHKRSIVSSDKSEADDKNPF